MEAAMRTGFETKTVTVRFPQGSITLTVPFWMWREAIVSRAITALHPVLNIRPEDCEIVEMPR